MILIRFGEWSSSSGRFFIWERLYNHVGEWTPLCRVRLRYLKTQKEAMKLSSTRATPSENEIALWSILDDIDTGLDMFKPDSTPYTEYVIKLLKRRFEILTSDGYNLFYPNSKPNGPKR